jgi:kynureninase
MEGRARGAVRGLGVEALSPTLEDLQALDAADPLAPMRARFALPPGIVYLDGNSLGPLPVTTAPRLQTVVKDEWGQGLIASWNTRDWIGAPARVGAKIAQVVGLDGDEVLVADSTSVNLFKLVVAAARLQTGRTEVLTELGNFPTDQYLTAGAAELLGLTLRAVPTAELEAAISPRTSVIVLTHVNYRSGHRHELARLTALAKSHGALVVWDLSHSVGAVPLNLRRDGVELAVGCGYKYLNGGPGAPAFLCVARALQARLHNPIPGWLGHAKPFAFDDAYQPAPGLERFLTGTPPMLSLLALEAGVDVFLEAPREALWEKSARLCEVFIALMRTRCPELILASPVEPERRGSHLSFAHPHAYALVQALIRRGVVGDFRTPDLARFGFTPLYVGYADLWKAVEVIAEVLRTGAWQAPEFQVRARVT